MHPLFTTALFTTAKTLKEPSAHQWVKRENAVHIRNGTLFSHKKNKILTFMTTWMDIEGIMLGEMSDKERQTSYDITWMWNLKNTRNY